MSSSTLPNHYVFSTKGMLEFDQLSMSEFVSGYLEYLKTQPGLSKPCLLNHLKLLMDKATTYSWPSVHHFHQSVHNAVQNRRMSWSDYGKIREHPQTFFTHLDFRASGDVAAGVCNQARKHKYSRWMRHSYAGTNKQ